MKKVTSFLVLALMLGVSSSVVAQSGPSVIKILKVDVNNKLAPPITVNNIVKSSSPSSGEWTAITVRFKVEGVSKKANALDDGTWLDKVSISWKGLFKARDGKYKKTQKAVKYESLTNGEYYATILVDPSSVNRYLGGVKGAKDLSVYAVFKVDGKTQLDTKIYVQNGKRQRALASGFTERVFDSENLDSVDGVFMSKDESPWAGAQWQVFPKISKQK